MEYGSPNVTWLIAWSSSNTEPWFVKNKKIVHKQTNLFETASAGSFSVDGSSFDPKCSSHYGICSVIFTPNINF